ncbi:hypothetical protein IGI04_035396, partial [Brassica rapa subsp. trilocularis]
PLCGPLGLKPLGNLEAKPCRELPEIKSPSRSPIKASPHFFFSLIRNLEAKPCGEFPETGSPSRRLSLSLLAPPLSSFSLSLRRASFSLSRPRLSLLAVHSREWWWWPRGVIDLRSREVFYPDLTISGNVDGKKGNAPETHGTRNGTHGDVGKVDMCVLNPAPWNPGWKWGGTGVSIGEFEQLRVSGQDQINQKVLEPQCSGVSEPDIRAGGKRLADDTAPHRAGEAWEGETDARQRRAQLHGRIKPCKEMDFWHSDITVKLVPNDGGSSWGKKDDGGSSWGKKDDGEMSSPVHHELGERRMRYGPKGTRAYARKPYRDAWGDVEKGNDKKKEKLRNGYEPPRDWWGVWKMDRNGIRTAEGLVGSMGKRGGRSVQKRQVRIEAPVRLSHAESWREGGVIHCKGYGLHPREPDAGCTRAGDLTGTQQERGGTISGNVDGKKGNAPETHGTRNGTHGDVGKVDMCVLNPAPWNPGWKWGGTGVSIGEFEQLRVSGQDQINQKVLEPQCSGVSEPDIRAGGKRLADDTAPHRAGEAWEGETDARQRRAQLHGRIKPCKEMDFWHSDITVKLVPSRKKK